MTVTLKAKVQFTSYYFGKLSEVEGKTLRLLERNSAGDCLCLVADDKGNDKCLIDVDHRDVECGSTQA